MRQLKFRGKTTANGHWVYGCLIDYGNNAISISNKRSNPWVQPETVGQFTGVKDKNGKEIYEGDIVRYKEANDEITTSAVRFVDAAFSPITEICWMGDGECEVIGNIFDNPNLLKGCKP